ncbi:MAG: hypothetical protein FJ143_04930 [Deltaproteobacteria bacterium]|nr:hypothetical protein [Acidimicrobiia bacterium]MBM4297065.1 hypothetical protein [Deltaproteobacteria bacterium]
MAKSEGIANDSVGGRRESDSKNDKDFMGLIEKKVGWRTAKESLLAHAVIAHPGFELFEIIQSIAITGLTLPER